MSLTPKQEAFCQAVAKPGPDGKMLSISDAYRRVYNCGKMKPESVNDLSSRLYGKVEIRSRIDELRQPAIEAVGVTLEDHLRNLERIRDAAFEAGQYSAAASAETARGKAAGLYTEKKEVKGQLTIGWDNEAE